MVSSEFQVWPAPAPTEWHAGWIAPPDAAGVPNYYFRARRRFVRPRGTSGPCLLHIAAESTYLLYVNGVPIGAGPARGACSVNFVDSFEIGSLLTDGDNWIAAVVHCPNVPTYKAIPAQPALLVQIEDLLWTDGNWEVQRAADWRGNVPKYTMQIGFIEWRDLRDEPRSWQTGQDRSTWQQPSIIAPAEELGKRLMMRDIPALNAIAREPACILEPARVPAPASYEDTGIAGLMTCEPQLPGAPPSRSSGGPTWPIEIMPDGEGGVVLPVDFARQITGFIEIDVEAEDGAILDIGYHEEPPDAGRPTFLTGKNAAYAFVDRFILRGGRQIVGPALSERGFRAVRLAIRRFGRPVLLHSIRGIDRRFPARPRALFSSDDPLLDATFRTCGETLSACATDVFIDSWRESAFWTCDLLVENLTWLQAFGDPRLNARSIRLALASLRPDGLMPGVCPSDGGDQVVVTSANLFLPIVLEQHWLYSGDFSLVEEALPSLARVLEAVQGWVDRDARLTPPARFWNFLDWSYRAQKIDLNGRATAVLGWLHVMALDAAARLFSAARRESEAGRWKRLADEAHRAVERDFWIEQDQRYAEWIEPAGPSTVSSELAHALAILSGRLPAPRRAQVSAALVQRRFFAPELFLHHLVLPALVAIGHPEAAVERIQRYWGPIVRSGSPTIWECNVYESGKAAFRGAGSLCHGFASTPIDFLQTVALGVRPRRPGFAEFSVAPHPLHLQRAAGAIPTPQGDISIAWTRPSSAAISVELTVPDRTTAVLADGQRLLPGHHAFTIAPPHTGPAEAPAPGT